MLKESLNGFCMALADSVPGVSGGTIAFIMGFYDKFIGSVHDLAFGSITERKQALKYLFKLGVGWAIGMNLANFEPFACLFDLILVFGMQKIKERRKSIGN